MKKTRLTFGVHALLDYKSLTKQNRTGRLREGKARGGTKRIWLQIMDGWMDGMSTDGGQSEIKLTNVVK